MIRFKSRNGVTLVEVIFAIGVVMIGLVGLISVLPIAGRRAQDAVGLSTANAVAVEAFDRLESFNLLRRGAWIVESDGGATHSTIFSTDGLLDPVTSFCIDPLFVADSYGRLTEGNTPSGLYVPYTSLGTNGHRRVFFPYFKQEYNPLEDPSQPLVAGNSWALWGAQVAAPRMVRVGLHGSGSMLSAAESALVGDDLDSVAYFDTEDDSLFTAAQMTAIVDSGIAYGKKLTKGRYTLVRHRQRVAGYRIRFRLDRRCPKSRSVV